MAKKMTANRRAPRSVQSALLVLSGVSAAVAFGSTASAQDPKKPAPQSAPTAVVVEKVAKPANVPVKTPNTWQRVVIELTPEQKAQLEKAGVKTDKLKITTFDIQKLASEVVN